MFSENIYPTFTESYLLMFLAGFTIAHIVYTRILRPPLKLEENVSYDLESSLNYGHNFLTEYAFIVIVFNVFTLPITALTSLDYLTFISISTLLMTILYFNDISFVKRNNYGNPGLVAYVMPPLFYFPVIAISALLHYLF